MYITLMQAWLKPDSNKRKNDEMKTNGIEIIINVKL